jgi:hypothetical protein
VVSISEYQAAPALQYRFEYEAKAAGGLPIAAGEQELTVSVTVVYGINHNLDIPQS